jgi:hypothetical protein
MDPFLNNTCRSGLGLMAQQIRDEMGPGAERPAPATPGATLLHWTRGLKARIRSVGWREWARFLVRYRPAMPTRP